MSTKNSFDNEIIKPVSENFITAYPNPCIGNVTISSKVETIQRIEILNINGISISSVISLNDKTVHLNTSGLKKGVYFLNILTKSNVYKIKIQVQ